MFINKDKEKKHLTPSILIRIMINPNSPKNNNNSKFTKGTRYTSQIDEISKYTKHGIKIRKVTRTNVKNQLIEKKKDFPRKDSFLQNNSNHQLGPKIKFSFLNPLEKEVSIEEDMQFAESQINTEHHSVLNYRIKEISIEKSSNSNTSNLGYTFMDSKMKRKNKNDTNLKEKNDFEESVEIDKNEVRVDFKMKKKYYTENFKKKEKKENQDKLSDILGVTFGLNDGDFDDSADLGMI